jgi:four helix bundle protein
VRFLQIAFASALELLHHFITSLDLGFLTPSEFEEMEKKLDPIRRMLTSLMARLRSPKERVPR